MKKLRVAVVGCRIGERHARTFRRLSALFDVVCLCDVDVSRAEAVARETGHPEVVADYGSVLRRRDVDLVSICTPPALHFEQVRQALDAGMHVLCEKPISGSLCEVDGLAAAERCSGRRVIPIFQLRFGSGVRKLKRLVDAGITGRAYLTSVETAWNRGSDYYAIPWRRSWQGALGGCLLGHAIHAHDLLCHVVGPVAKVSAFAKTLVNNVETEDCAAAALEMANGSLASVAVTLGSKEEISRLRFCFEQLVAESNTSPYENSSEPWRFIGASSIVDDRIRAALRDFPAEPEGYEGQFVQVYHGLMNDKPLPLALSDARASIELATALYQSAALGRRVELPLDSANPMYAGWQPFFARAKGGAAEPVPAC